MRILLTNDDGIDAPGLGCLYDAIKDLGEVHVIAPAKVQSATSHAVTFHRPIRVEQKTIGNFTGLAVHGRPADCTKLAIEELLDGPVDLVISGINAGANIGINVIYSGTVAAAMEAAFIGVPAIAVSLHVGDWENIDWETAAKHALDAIQFVMSGPLQPHKVVNVNIPILDGGVVPKGIKVVPISHSPMVMKYRQDRDDDGHQTYEVCNEMEFARHDADTDLDAILQKYITITPLHYDLTHEAQMRAWETHLEKSGRTCV
ncbi:5'/3'-nucleotidase SurE [Poriferisphaera sp. WC338]|uniref:5'/3'-nucleotidase SurE n=1 Tax=Poriferisphaera sp. WC338 TaxID=3425129 RepID=UPI003D819BAF